MKYYTTRYLRLQVTPTFYRYMNRLSRLNPAVPILDGRQDIRRPEYFETNLLEITTTDGRFMSVAVGGIQSVKLRIIDKDLKEHEYIGMTGDCLFNAVWSYASED